MLALIGSVGGFLQEGPLTGPEGAQQIFSYALGLLDALEILGWLKALGYLLLVVVSTKLVFGVMRGGN